MSTVVEYLKSLPGIVDVKPVEVTIKKITYKGAEYIDTKHPYKNKRYYLVGDRPKHRRQNKTCYILNGNDWYVAGYYEGSEFGEYDKYHPLGYYFLIMKWDVPSKIDQYENKPYDRVPMVVRYL